MGIFWGQGKRIGCFSLLYPRWLLALSVPASVKIRDNQAAIHPPTDINQFALHQQHRFDMEVINEFNGLWFINESFIMKRNQ